MNSRNIFNKLLTQLIATKKIDSSATFCKTKMTTIALMRPIAQSQRLTATHSRFDIFRPNSLHKIQSLKYSINRSTSGIQLLVDQKKPYQAQKSSAKLMELVEQASPTLIQSDLELKNLIINAYTLHATLHLNMGTREAKIAFDTFERLLKLDENNRYALEKTDELKYVLGMLVAQYKM